MELLPNKSSPYWENNDNAAQAIQRRVQSQSRPSSRSRATKPSMNLLATIRCIPTKSPNGRNKYSKKCRKFSQIVVFKPKKTKPLSTNWLIASRIRLAQKKAGLRLACCRSTEGCAPTTIQAANRRRSVFERSPLLKNYRIETGIVYWADWLVWLTTITT